MIDAAKYAFGLADNPNDELNITQKLREYIAERVRRFAQSTNDETVAALEETIAEGLQEGDSNTKMRNRIKAVYKYVDTVRAERIARTETLAASNAGANEAYKQSPLVVAKEFSAEADACDICLALNGKVVGLESSFAKNGETIQGVDSDGNPTDQTYNVNYGDIEYPPVHPNCRCSILPVASK